MGDIIEVEQIGLFSPRFWVSIFRGRPMVVSINVWDQFRTDREDGALEDTVFDDVVTNWHAIVIKGWKMYDSRRDQKTYSFTRQYFESVQGLFKSNRVLLFKKG